MSKLVLFDLDGTLLDTARDFTEVLNRQLGAHAVPPLSYEEVRETVSAGARALVKRGFRIDENHPRFNEFLQELLDLYDEQIPLTRAATFEGVDELLENIGANNIPWGIVTNKPARFTTPLLENFPAFHDRAVVICADQLQRSKPDPEGLLLACSTVGREPQDCIYVGDHPRDIEAGKNAGMQTVAVGWGYFPTDTRLEDWQADLIVEHPAELKHFLFGP